MAKIYGLFGAMTGKVADVVMAVRNGEQVARKYQPVVANPSTALQVQNRAKLKLMSQLSAVMAPVIAMRKAGVVSSRNLFTKVNYKLATYSNNTASIALDEIQLTSSVVSLPGVTIARSGSAITAQLQPAVGGMVLSRVVYALFTKQPDNTLRLRDTQVVSTPGVSNTFTASFEDSSLEHVILAYGVRDNTDAARATFGNMEAASGVDVATLIANRTLTDADVTLTETKGATLAAAA